MLESTPGADMSDAISTIALGVKTDNALEKLQLLTDRVKTLKSEIAGLNGVMTQAESTTGMARGLTTIVSELRKVNTNFDDLGKSISKHMGMGGKATDDLKDKTKELVQEFMQGKKSAKEFVDTMLSLEQAAVSSARSIAKVNRDGEMSYQGYQGKLQETINYTHQVAAATDALSKKYTLAAAAKEAFHKSGLNYGPDRSTFDAAQGVANKVEFKMNAQAQSEALSFGPHRKQWEAAQGELNKATVKLAEETTKAGLQFGPTYKEYMSAQKQANFAAVKMAEEQQKAAMQYGPTIKEYIAGMKKQNLTEVKLAEEGQKHALSYGPLRSEWESAQKRLNLATIKAADEQLQFALSFGPRRADLDAAMAKQAIAAAKFADKLAFSHAMSFGPTRADLNAATKPPKESTAIQSIDERRTLAQTEAKKKLTLADHEAANAAKLNRDQLHLQTKAMSDAHSAARGLAGGLNMLWVTWGSTAPLIAGAAITATLRGIYEEGKAVEHQLMFVKALSDVKGEEVSAPQLEGMIEGTGARLQDAANGLRLLKQAGLETNEALLSLNSTMTMSVVGELPMGRAAEVMTGALKAFDLGADQAERVSDVIVKAASSSNASVSDMAQAFKYAAPAAAQYNMSLEETAAHIALLSEQNIKGSMAGTTFVNLMNSLRAPTAEASKTFEKLGFDFHRLQNEGKDSIEIITELRDKLATLDPGSKASAISKITDVRGSRELNIMLGGGLEKAEQIRESLRNATGFGQQAMLELQDTVEASSARMQQALAGAFTHAFMQATGPIQSFQDSMANLFRSNDFRDFVDQLATGLVNISRMVREHGDTIMYVVGAYAGLKTITSITSMLNGLLLAWDRNTLAARANALASADAAKSKGAVAAAATASAAALSAEAKAQAANGVAKAAGVTALTRVVTGLGMATTGLGMLITVLGSAYSLWQLFAGSVNKAADANDHFTNTAQNTLSALRQQIERTERLNKLMREGKDISSEAEEKRTISDNIEKQAARVEALKKARTDKGGLFTSDTVIAPAGKKGEDIRMSVDEYRKTLSDAEQELSEMRTDFAKAQEVTQEKVQLTIAKTFSKGADDLEKSYNLAIKNTEKVAEKQKLSLAFVKAKAALAEGGAAKDVSEAEERVRNAQTIFESSKNKVEFTPPKKTTSGVDRGIKQEQSEIIEAYRHAEKLAKMQRDNDVRMAKDALDKRLINDIQYFNEASLANEEYNRKRAEAEEVAVEKIAALKDKAVKEETKKGLDNAVKTINRGEEDGKQAQRLAEEYRVQQDINAVLAEEAKLRQQTVPADRAASERARGLQLEAYAMSLLTEEERRLVEAKTQTEEKYAKQIEAMKQEIELAQIALESAQQLADRPGLEGADKEAADRAAEAEAIKMASRQRSLDLITQQMKLESKLATETAKQVNAQNKWNSALQQSVTIASRLEGAFGRVGKAMGGLLTSAIRMAKEEQDIETKKRAALKRAEADGASPAELHRIEMEASRESAEAQIRNYGDILGAAQGFFKEGSRGYEALGKAEKVFRAFELALALQNFVQKVFFAQTEAQIVAEAELQKAIAADASAADIIAAAMAEGQASAVAGVAAQGQGDPYSAWARMAAMAATMAALGFAVSGGGGGGAKPLYEERQKNQSKGTVLGMEDEVSKSMDNALQRMQDNSYIELRQQQEMIMNLVGIKDGIARLTRTLVTSMPGVRGTPADMLAGGFGSWESDFWGFNSGSRELLDSGIVQEWAQRNSIGGLRAGQGMNVMQYQDIYEEESSWWGLDTDSEQYRNLSAAPMEFQRQLGQVIVQIGDTLADAAVGLGYGEQEIRSRLNSMEVSFGGLSLQGMNAEEAQQAINDRMNQLADSMTNSLIGGWINQFQRAGEGMAETLLRVSNDVTVARYELDKLGVSMINVADVTNKTGDIGAELVRQSVMREEVLAYHTQTLFSGLMGGFVGNIIGGMQVLVPEYTGIGRLMETMQGSATELAAAYKQLQDIQAIVRETSGSMNANWFGAEAIRGAGGLDEFARGIEAFQSEFFSEEAVRRMKMDTLANQFRELGLWVPTTREEFRRLVLSFSANTEMYGRLVSMADEFAAAVEESAGRVKTAEEKLADTTSWVDELTSSTQSLFDTVKGGRTLSREITKQLGGSTVAALEEEKQRLKLAMQQSLSVEQELELAEELFNVTVERYETEITALSELRDLSKEISDYADSLMLGEMSPLTNSQKLGYAQSEYESLLARARSGDKDAMSKLQGAADQYLESARTIYASSDQYTSIFNSVYGALQQLALVTGGNAEDRIKELEEAQKLELTALRTATDQLVVQASAYYLMHMSVLQQQLKVEEQQALALGQLSPMNDRLSSMPADIAANLAALLGRSVSNPVPANPALDGSHAGGLAYVPFDGYIAELHRGERVLTAAEARSADGAIQEEIRALRAQIAQLIEEQRQQTGDLIRAAYDSTDRSSDKVVDGTKEAAENAAWVKQAKVEIV